MKTIKTRIIVGLVIIAVMAAMTVALFTALNTKRLFDTYLENYRESRQRQWAETLAEYYGQRGTWTGINQLLMWPGEQTMPGMMRGRRAAASSEQVIVANVEGKIVVSTSKREGAFLSSNEIKAAAPIVVGNKAIGYVLLKVDYELPGFATIEQQFITAVYYSSLAAGLIIAILAAAVGIVFSNRLVLPLKQLTASAKKIARGEWDIKVDEGRQDEIGELAQSFNKMAQNLKAMELVRKTLVADVAHELRTPLATLRAQLESIQEGVTPADTEVILSLNDEVIRLSKLVNDLQDLSLAEVGKLRLVKEPVKIKGLLERIVGIFRGSVQNKEVFLELHIEELTEMSLDPQRIAQVIINLLANAIRHTPDGGKIIVSAKEQKQTVWVEVFNEGDNIPEEDLSHIFQRFYRVDKGRAREHGGTGLGLAITKGLVEAHGGKIGVENLPGGVKFYFTLPKG
ncbi:MAG: ATP-binding protein [Bacillota bacterium]